MAGLEVASDSELYSSIDKSKVALFTSCSIFLVSSIDYVFSEIHLHDVFMSLRYFKRSTFGYLIISQMIWLNFK